MLYYVYVEGRSVGPLPIEGLRPYVESGAMTGDTLAWTEALERWQSARTITDLVAAFPALAIPTRLSKPRPAMPAAAEGFALAGFGRRFAAGVIDFLLIGLPLTIFMVALGPAEPGEARSVLIPGVDWRDWLFLLVSALYFIGFMSKAGGGRTPGYRLMKLRLVERASQSPPGWAGAFLWALVNSINLIGFLWYFFDAKRRMLHNIASDTIVLKVQ